MMAKPPQVVGDMELLGRCGCGLGGIQNCWGLQRACGCSTWGLYLDEEVRYCWRGAERVRPNTTEEAPRAQGP